MFTLVHRERAAGSDRATRAGSHRRRPCYGFTGRKGVAEASVRVDRIHAAPRALGVGAARHLPRVKHGKIGGFEGEPAVSSPWGQWRGTQWAPSSSGAFRPCCGTPQPASGSSERIESGREHREGCCEAQRLCRRGASACSIPWFRGMEMVRRCGMVRRRGMARGGAACRSSRRSRSTAASASISASCPRSAPGEVKGEG